jgi:hypothetical protein
MAAGKVHRATARQRFPQGIVPIQAQGRMVVVLPREPALHGPKQGS